MISMNRLTLALLLLGTPVLRAGAMEPPSVRIPVQTRVAILPVVVATDEKDERVRVDQATRAEEEARRLFAERGFVVVEPGVTAKALSEAGAPVRFRNEVERSVGLSSEVGKALGADWVVVVVVDVVEQRRIHSQITDATETLIEVGLRLWLSGRQGEAGLPAGEKVGHQLRAAAFEPGGTRRQREAVVAAVRSALRAPLAPFPVKKEEP
jgi:hypothetical protein